MKKYQIAKAPSSKPKDPAPIGIIVLILQSLSYFDGQRSKYCTGTEPKNW
jgi:hypothetical protein